MRTYWRNGKKTNNISVHLFRGHPSNTCFLINIPNNSKRISQDEGKSYPSDKIQAKMALDVTTKISRQAMQNCLFIYSSSSNPFILIKTSNTLSQIFWKLTMLHPLFSISSLESPFLEPQRQRLQVCLHARKN